MSTLAPNYFGLGHGKCLSLTRLEGTEWWCQLIPTRIDLLHLQCIVANLILWVMPHCTMWNGWSHNRCSPLGRVLLMLPWTKAQYDKMTSMLSLNGEAPMGPRCPKDSTKGQGSTRWQYPKKIPVFHSEEFREHGPYPWQPEECTIRRTLALLRTGATLATWHLSTWCC